MTISVSLPNLLYEIITYMSTLVKLFKNLYSSSSLLGMQHGMLLTFATSLIEISLYLFFPFEVTTALTLTLLLTRNCKVLTPKSPEENKLYS